MENYEMFMNFLNTKGRDLGQYVKRYSRIFSDKSGTELLQDIQFMKEELNMVSAVFMDQKSVLEKVGEVIDKSRKALLEKAGEDIHNNKIASLKSRPSAFNFQQQSEMHAEHIDRMQIQASLAYDNVRLVSFEHISVLTQPFNSFRIFRISSSSDQTP
jgi:hypothetical protein